MFSPSRSLSPPPHRCLCRLQGQPPPTLILHGRYEARIFRHDTISLRTLVEVSLGGKGEKEGKQNRGIENKHAKSVSGVTLL